MKKKIILSVSLSLLLVLGITGAVFASGNVKLIINGKSIATDVSPKVVNGRVLVPISTVSKELHSVVQWDAAKNSVIVNPDTWTSEQEIDRGVWVWSRNKILEFFIAYDSRDMEGALALLDENFTSNRLNKSEIMPVSGFDSNIIDFKFRDVAYVKSKLTVRVQVITKMDKDLLKVADWDFTFSGTHPSNGKITSIQVSNERDLNEYTVFPGLTIDNKDYLK